jgi:GDSL-like Lipase/Acylhydrolase family
MSTPTVLRAFGLAVLASTLSCGGEARQPEAAVPAAQAGTQVYLKVDFDAGENPFAPTDPAQATLVADANQALSGRSLHIARSREGRYIGATVPLPIKGSPGLKIAFAVRARSMRTVAVNVFDQRRQDNTTPASPARVFDDEWHPVVFAVEDFHYNSDPPDRKIEPETDFASLLLHGREDGSAAELWVDKLVVYRGPDERPPDAPTAVRGNPDADGSVVLTWQEPADNTFAVVYSVHRKSGTGTWEKIGESLRSSYRDRPSSLEPHAYRITAADYENNISAPSPEVTATPTVAATTKPASGNAPPWMVDRATYAENVRQVHARGVGKVRPDVFLFAGDSLTAATVYTQTLGSWLARGLTVRQGVGTVTTEYGAANIKGYLADARPEFAVVMYGTNDMEPSGSIPDAMRNLGVVLDGCLEFGTVPVLATIPPRGFDKRDQQGQERFNRAVAELGRKKRVPLSYVFEEMMRHDLKEMLYDGIHLQPEGGNEAAGRALRQTMDQVYYALRDASGRW